MMLHCQKPTVVLLLGTILTYICSGLSQVNEICSSSPSEPVISYNFAVVSGPHNVCPASASQGVWVFRPADNTPGTYTVSGTNLSRCLYNDPGSQRVQLVVTPTDQGSGDFRVTFVSQSGMAVALTVSYVPTGFYREVNESIVQRSSFTEPLWRSIGVALRGITVCQQSGSGLLESVPFLARDVLPVDPSTCLPGVGIFPNPLYISLGISGEVPVPNDLIGETLSIVLVNGSCQNPVIRSDIVTIRILNATIPTSVLPSPSPLPSPSSVPTVSTTTTTTDSPGGNNAGLIAGVVVGVVGALLLIVGVPVVLSAVFGLLHLNKIRKNSLSRRASRASISRQSSTEKGERPPEVGIELEHEPRNRDVLRYAPLPPPVHASPPPAPLHASPPTLPVEVTDSGGNFIIVVTPFKKVAEYLASKHGVSLQPLATSEQTSILNGYSHHVSSALADNKCQFVYFIWNCSLEETSMAPLSDLVRELASRPLPSEELKKVIFVQLGSKFTHPIRIDIHQFAVEVSPDTDHFNPQECAQLIYDRVQKEVDSDAVDGVVQRTTRTVENEVTPTDTSSPLYNSLQSPPPPSYDATVNPDDPRTRSLPPSIERTRAERLRAGVPSSADSSPLIGILILETNKAILEEFRGLRSTHEQATEKEAARSEKQTKLMEQEAVRSEKRTELAEKRTGLMEQEIIRSEERNDKLVAAVGEVDTDIKQVAEDVQNLGDRIDEVTLVDESETKNSFSS